jgi:transposase
MLSEEENAKIKQLYAEHGSIRKVVEKSKFAYQTVWNVLNNVPRKKRRSPAVPKKITKRSGQKILDFIRRERRQDHLVNSTIIKDHFKLDCTTRTIRNFLQEKNVSYEISKKEITLEDRHKQARVVFAETHIKRRTDFKIWVFTDEKKFSLDGPDNNGSYEIVGTPKPIRSRRQQGGGKCDDLGSSDIQRKSLPTG